MCLQYGKSLKCHRYQTELAPQRFSWNNITQLKNTGSNVIKPFTEDGCQALIPLMTLSSGKDFHPTSNTLIHGTHVPSSEGIDRMVEDVEKQ